MDLIYANENMEDIGVMKDYELDLAFGKDENDFSCTIPIKGHCCRSGYYLYVEGTEYGGIIDKIKVDTWKKDITYIGRTWHGILEKKIVCPDDGMDYLTLKGEANDIISFLVERSGLNELFISDTTDTGVRIDYQVQRYDNLYNVFCKMLETEKLRLCIEYTGRKVKLSSAPIVDYSQDEEWDSDQVDFNVEKNYRPINHLVCLGKGDLSQRNVIHLFTDENGGVQKYKTVETPIQDSDYILTTQNQLLFGENEVAEVYDYSGAETAENYSILESQPSDWDTNFYDYYIKQNGEYKNVEKTMQDVYYPLQYQPSDWGTNYKDYYIVSNNAYVSVQDANIPVYTQLTSKPSDWDANYKNYYFYNGQSYVQANSVMHESYVAQFTQPNDWITNYANYYNYYTDGVTEQYNSVQGDTKYRYHIQTKKPTDWDTNWKNYYRKNTQKQGYIKLQDFFYTTVPTWKPKLFYTQESYYVAPIWGTQARFTYKKNETVPIFTTLYYRKTISTVPTWETNKYFVKRNEVYIPTFTQWIYYKKVLDNYTDLVTRGLEKIKESYECDKIDIKFDANKEYNVGDIVGATEHITGITVWQKITKKIVKISKDIELDYEIG